MQFDIPRTMKKTSHGAVSSLVFTSGVVGTAANLGKVFGRPSKSSQRHSGNMPSHSQPNTRKGSQQRGFRIFRPRRNPKTVRPRVMCILPPSSVYPIAVEPSAVLDDDDDLTSECSDITSPSWSHSVSNFDALYCESSLSLSGSTRYMHNTLTEALAEVNEECDDQETQSETEPATPPPQPEITFAGCYRRASLPGSTPIPIAGQACHSMSLDDLPGSLYHKHPTPSESWDKDFDLGSKEIRVPSSVKGSQLSIRMDMHNIRDFTNQIETLKSLRAKRNQLYDRLENTWPAGVADRRRLESTYNMSWEEADVIIDLSDSVQDQPPMFGGGRRITVGVEHQSDHRLQVLKRLFVAGTGSDVDRPFPDFDDDSNDDDDDDDDVFMEAGKSMDDDEDEFDMILLDDDAYEYDESDKENCVVLGDTGASANRPLDSTDEDGWGADEPEVEKTRREQVRISVENMPGLIDHLKQLHERLTQHVDQLSVSVEAGKTNSDRK